MYWRERLLATPVLDSIGACGERICPVTKEWPVPKPIILDASTQAPVPADTVVECRASCGRDSNWSWEGHKMCHEKAVVCWIAKCKAKTVWFFCRKHGEQLLKGQHTVRERYRIELDPKPVAKAAASVETPERSSGSGELPAPTTGDSSSEQ